jgi:tRNA threonylcarbamoyladenosine biosynthesis protein TsaE
MISNTRPDTSTESPPPRSLDTKSFPHGKPDGGEGSCATRVVIPSNNVSETLRIGKRIGTFLRPGDVVALVGDLGTGKTHLIKGLAAGVGVKKAAYMASPSFVLINEYPGKIPFNHLDLYRLETEEEARDAGVEELLQGGGVTAIEWADKFPSLLPREGLRITLRAVGEQTRIIEITGSGIRYATLVKKCFPVNPE